MNQLEDFITTVIIIHCHQTNLLWVGLSEAHENTLDSLLYIRDLGMDGQRSVEHRFSLHRHIFFAYMSAGKTESDGNVSNPLTEWQTLLMSCGRARSHEVVGSDEARPCMMLNTWRDQVRGGIGGKGEGNGIHPAHLLPSHLLTLPPPHLRLGRPLLVICCLGAHVAPKVAVQGDHAREAVQCAVLAAGGDGSPVVCQDLAG